MTKEILTSRTTFNYDVPKPMEHFPPTSLSIMVKYFGSRAKLDSYLVSLGPKKEEYNPTLDSGWCISDETGMIFTVDPETREIKPTKTVHTKEEARTAFRRYINDE